jgi:hypothetical protein
LLIARAAVQKEFQPSKGNDRWCLGRGEQCGWSPRKCSSLAGSRPAVEPRGAHSATKSRPFARRHKPKDFDKINVEPIQALKKYVSSDAKRLSGQRTQTAPAQSQIRGFPFIGSINSPMVSFAVPSVAFEGEEWVVFLPFVHHVHGRTTE